MAQQVRGEGPDDHLVTDDHDIAGSLLNREDDVEEPVNYRVSIFPWKLIKFLRK